MLAASDYRRGCLRMGKPVGIPLDWLLMTTESERPVTVGFLEFRRWKSECTVELPKNDGLRLLHSRPTPAISYAPPVLGPGPYA